MGTQWGCVLSKKRSATLRGTGWGVFDYHIVAIGAERLKLIQLPGASAPGGFGSGLCEFLKFVVLKSGRYGLCTMDFAQAMRV
jgi:hypothetical protein